MTTASFPRFVHAMRAVRERGLAWILLLVSCGARTDLGGLHGTDAGLSGTCSAPPPAPASCTAWHAGTPQPIGTGTIGDATASGCGVLAAWYTSTGTSIAWSTRWIDFDGAMLAPPLAHPSLAAQTGSGAMSMAEHGMLEDDEMGCHFVTVDVSGNEQDFTSLGAGFPRCSSLARVGSKWSFLRSDGVGASLVVFGNGPQIETPLVFAQSEDVWDRVVFADGSFLVSASWFDENTAKSTNWLTPFDAKGVALGPSIPVSGVDSAPVLLARAGDHAMAVAAWQTNVNALPVTTLGGQLSLAQNVTTDSRISTRWLFTQPNGDVLVAWIEGDGKGGSSIHARVIAPDGTPRGPATFLLDGVMPVAQLHGAIESTGARALLTVMMNDGTIEALPLTCQ